MFDRGKLPSTLFINIFSEVELKQFVEYDSRNEVVLLAVNHPLQGKPNMYILFYLLLNQNTLELTLHTLEYPNTQCLKERFHNTKGHSTTYGRNYQDALNYIHFSILAPMGFNGEAYVNFMTELSKGLQNL